MTMEGTIQNGVVVLDEKHQLADGTRVEVVVREQPKDKPTLSERLLKLAGCIDDLPEDMAKNHDHYLYGTSKK